MTFEELYMNHIDSAEYEAARAAKVKEIEKYITDRIVSEIDAAWYAESLMSNCEEMGSFDGDCINAEIPGRHTLTGNPIPFSI